MFHLDRDFLYEIKEMIDDFRGFACRSGAFASPGELLVRGQAREALSRWQAGEEIFALDESLFRKLMKEQPSPILEHRVLDRLGSRCPMILLPEDAPMELDFPASAFWPFLDEGRLTIFVQYLNFEAEDYGYAFFFFDFDPTKQLTSISAALSQAKPAQGFLHVAIRSVIRMCLKPPTDIVWQDIKLLK